MNDQTTNLDLVSRGVIPAAVIAAGLTGPVAWSAPGDLDFAFGDAGRVELPKDLNTSLAIWSLEATTGGEYLLGGGEEYCGYYYYSCDEDPFAVTLSSSGTPDPAYVPATPEDLSDPSVVAMKDGRLVGVGRSYATDNSVVFRLAADGSLDSTFGTGGAATLDRDLIEWPNAITVDPDGRIVVTARRGNVPALLRMMSDGNLDPSFGSNGVALQSGIAGSSIGGAVRTPDGAYRMLVSPGSGDCRLSGVTAAGAIDDRFGTAGVIRVEAGAPELRCTRLDPLPDGRLLLTGWGDLDGSGDWGAIVLRLLPDGSVDTTFATDVRSYLSSVQAVTASSAGSVFVAGPDRDYLPGTVVARLLPDGRVDPGFGSEGKAWIDLQGGSDSYARSTVLIAPSADHILVAGAQSHGWYARPFVARLTLSGEGPGVVGVKTSRVQALEAERQATVVVRRTGGSAGSVSVGYRTVTSGGSGPAATIGDDFQPVQGRLEWAAGDTSDKTIVVPILGDQVPYEPGETFFVTLEDPQGGGLGTSEANVTIAGDGYPHGAFQIVAAPSEVRESDLKAVFYVYRWDGGAGVVSVDVESVAGTAQDADFSPVALTLTWAEGDASYRRVEVSVNPDGETEGDETFSMKLSNPTGGSVIDPGAATATVTIHDSATLAKRYSGGGGATGLASLLLLGLGVLRRLVRKAARNGP